MLRALSIPSALLLMAATPVDAAPPRRQPTPASVQPTAGEPADATTATMQRTLKAQQEAQKAADIRNKAWDAKLKKTMGGVCQGC